VSTQSQIKTEAQKNLEVLKKHLTGVILPAWMERGWDETHGGFCEKLEGDGKPVDVGFRRLHATTRQLFVFSEWSRLWNQADCTRLAHKTYDYLMKCYWDQKSEGWVAKVDTQGNPSDYNHELYGTAFVIFALARYGKIFSNKKAIETAHQTMSMVQKHMKHPAKGFFTATDRDWKGLSNDIDQNPHMHLFEALQALNAAGPTDESIALENSLAEIMATVFYDKQAGVVREHFDNTGKSHAEKGHVVEAGHQFEWYWLAQGASNKPYQKTLAPLVGKMYEWGVKYGIDQVNGGVYDVNHIDGHVTQSTKRIWPTTEFIRAAACRWKKEGDEQALVQMNQQLEVLNKSFMSPQGWNEALDEKMKPIRSDMPVTTSYHMTTCYLDSVAMLGHDL